MSLINRQQNFVRHFNEQMRRQASYISSWNALFYQNFEWETYPAVEFPLNFKRTTKIRLERNNIETYAGYTYSNGHPLSADGSVTSYKINPEYFKLDVKSNPAFYVQGQIATFYTDGVVVDDGYVDIINTGSTNPGLKITQTGSADSFVVYDQAGDSTPFVINNAGRTGIGTPTPGATLDVRGTASQVALAVNTNNTDSDFQVGSTTRDDLIYGDASTSRVGINNGTPLAALDIFNPDTSVPALRITQTGNQPAIYVNTSNNANANFQFASSLSNFLLFGNASNSRIGINMDAPTATLQVSGTPNLSALIVNANNSDSDFQFGSTKTDYLLFGDAGNSRIGINTNIPTGTLEISGSPNLSALVVNANNADADFQFGSTISDYLLFGDAGAGEIGINTSNPLGSLDIFGTANVSALVVNANNADSDFQFGSTTNDYLLFGDASTHRIGINTARPNATLTVQGTISGENIYARDGIGYQNSNSVTQIGNKSSSVTLHAPTGLIIMSNAAMLDQGVVSFTLTNDYIGANDLVLVQHVGGGVNLGQYLITANPSSGSALIYVKNTRGTPLDTGGWASNSLSEAIQIRFAVIKSGN